MILADTSIWVDHLKSGRRDLIPLLERALVLGHPWVLGELLLGGLRSDAAVPRLFEQLPRATVATTAEVLTLIADRGLSGRGIGLVDAQLLAATLLTPDARLWTADRRLLAVAEDLDVAWMPE